MRMSSLLPQQSFLQTDLWGSFRESLGWHAHKVGDVLVLERRLPFGKSFLYSPEVVATPDMLLELLPKIYDIAKDRQSIFYRLELLIDKQAPNATRWQAAFSYTGFTKAFEEVQPEHRQIIPLDDSNDTILRQMKQKGRYNIRVAEKAGVLVRETTKKSLKHDVDTFYGLLEATGKRDKFSIRPKSYFVSLVDMLYEHNCGRMFTAYLNDTPLASAIITLHDNFAAYLYGASGNEHRNIMAPYAVHWSAMQWAASQGAASYDLLAIRPPKSESTPKPHPYDGITRFKQQFGGEEIHLLGSWDLVFQPAWYTLFRAAEKIRRH